MKKTGILFALFFLLSLSVYAMAQQERVNLKLENVSLKDFFREVQRQTGLYFVYNDEICQDFGEISVIATNEPVEHVLDDVFGKTSYSYQFEGDIIIVQQKQQQSQQPKAITVSGTVKDVNGGPLPGVGILIKGTALGTTTDKDGKYSITCPVAEGLTLLYSFVGMKTQEVEVKGRTQIDIVLEEEATEIDEVVVTGIYTRKKESFTGSSQTYDTEELKMVGNQNLLQSLKTLDPSFVILEDNQYGSDPNHLPDIEIRGKTSIIGFKEEFGQDPNQPLFILDGFETTLQTVMDLSMDRIASVTILKDAASTAIYGSKAANGVVVVETKVPARGRVRLSYNGNYDISFADLTDYNLMNAREKLEFERLAGNFKSDTGPGQEQMNERYYDLLEQVERGVDTYWMSEPLRVAFNHRHNLYVEGGDDQMRYGLGVSYSNVDGVMKNSIRDILGANLDLLYRKNKIK